MAYELENREIENLLKRLGENIGSRLPKGWGFALNLFSFGPNGAMFYISNANRRDMVAALRECIKKIEGE